MFVQRFHDDAPPMDPALFHAVFGPYIDRAEPECHFFHLRAPDGGEAWEHGDRRGAQGAVGTGLPPTPAAMA